MKELKDITVAFFGEIVVGAVVVILSIALAYAITGCFSYAAITAPESARPGELVRVTSDTEADWIVAPEEYNRTSYIDSNKKTLVIANPKEGTVYIFAATTDRDNSPKAFCWRLEITDSAPDEPVPPLNPDPDVQPEPPVKPEPVFPETVALAAQDVESPNWDKERQNLVYVLNATITFIDNKSVLSPAGARETIRRNWTVRAATISADSETLWAPVLIKIFQPLNSTNIDEIKAALEQSVKALEGATK